MPSLARKKSRHGKRRGAVWLWTRRLYRSFWILTLVFVAFAVNWVVNAPLSVYAFDAVTALGQRSGLVLRDLNIYGAYYTQPQDLQDQLDIKEGDSLFAFSPESSILRMMALPWIEGAEIYRIFPDRLYVFVREKKPAAVWVTPQGTATLIDNQGKPIVPKTSGSHNYLLRIRGDGAGDHLKALLSLLGQRHYLKQNVSVADFVGRRRWDLLLRNQTQILLPEKNWDAALNQLDTYLQNDNLIERGVKKIDLRLPDHIVVEP
ncbi:MAG: cell division protein FtsQ/DivIB [Alphaproteobacteria bacterium]